MPQMAKATTSESKAGFSHGTIPPNSLMDISRRADSAQAALPLHGQANKENEAARVNRPTYFSVMGQIPS
jgi:hypothetical protein